MSDRFWISLNYGQTWREVTKDEWVNLERTCGFSRRPGEPATTAFSRMLIRGTTLMPQKVDWSWGDPVAND